MTQEEFASAMVIKLGEVILEKAIGAFPKQDSKHSKKIGEVLRDFINARAKTLMVVNAVVLSNRRIFLEDIYVPLTIKSNTESFKIDSYPIDLFNSHSAVLIADTAGMGKSTLMRKLFLSSIYQNLAIPFLIELRRLNVDQSIFSFILSELEIAEESQEASFLKILFRRGGFVFFLDGYDEVKESNRESISFEIRSFVETNFNENRFFITSRPEESLAQFGVFEKFFVRGLEMLESISLIKKYDVTNEISDLLIEKLMLPENASLSEFLKNPLLTSLLFRAFEFKQTIPLKKNQFYRQVYDANYESHDLTKTGAYKRPKKSGLDIEDFHRILRYIGFDCFKRQTVEFESKDDILRVIFNAIKFYQMSNCKSSDFLTDLLTTVPLFTKDGNYYKWCHRSLQEYFAAQFIFLDSRSNQGKILLDIYNHDSFSYYFNTLDLYSDIDPIGFSNGIEIPFLRDYIAELDMLQAKNITGVSGRDIIRRINATFLHKISITQSSKKSLLRIPNKIRSPYNYEKISDRLFVNLANALDAYSPTIVSDYHTTGVRTWPRYGLNTYVMISMHVKALIFNLLVRMGRNYIMSYTSDKPKYYVIKIPTKFQDKGFILDLNSDLCFNDPGNFTSVTKIIEHVQGRKIILDKDIAQAEIDRILLAEDASSSFLTF